jgi:hypothetical protein
MLIIAGSLVVDPSDRAKFLAVNADVVSQARQAAGCLDFVRADDPLDPSRINIFERCDTKDHLLAFRGEGEPESDSPPIQSADVKRYVIAAVEDPSPTMRRPACARRLAPQQPHISEPPPVDR